MDAQRRWELTVERWNDLLLEVQRELGAQVDQWGYQNHPLINNVEVRGKYVTISDMWHELNDLRVKNNDLSWDGILLEEVYEALTERDTKKRRAELVQVAAVALAMAECDERNNR